MRTAEINKWIDEGGSIPEDLTQEEKDHLTKLGWSVEEEWHPNGQKWCEQHFLHGKEHGQKERWYENGQKDYEHHFFHGKHHGKQEGWYEDGQKKCEHHCFHGMKHGVFKEWYEDGNLFRGEEYYYGNKIKKTS